MDPGCWIVHGSHHFLWHGSFVLGLLAACTTRLAGGALCGAMWGSSDKVCPEHVAEEDCPWIPGVELCPTVVDYSWDSSFMRQPSCCSLRVV